LVSFEETFQRMNVALLIPSYRGAAHLRTLLPTVLEQTLQPAEIWIGDEDDAGTREAAVDHGAFYLRLERNDGFAATVNRLAEASRAPYIAVLNNDVRLHPQWLEKLHPHLATHPFATGKLRAWDGGTLDGSWDLLSLSGFPLRCGHGKRDAEFYSRRREISFAPWTAILMRREYFEAMGGLDESFGSFYEDVDFGLRSCAKGYRGAYEPAAECWHRGSATFGAKAARQVELSARNQLLLLAKHGGGRWIERWPAEFWVGQGLSLAAAARHGQLRAALRGKRAGWRALRETSSKWSEDMAQALEAMQGEVFEASQQGGADPFWRYYWALTL
jgi:GT2 family glycosyltransferase